MSNTNKINHDLDCDVVVIGAGVAGLGAGYFLSEQAKVVVLEQEDQPGYHSSGRSAALYIEGYENPVVAGLTAQSGDFFRTQQNCNEFWNEILEFQNLVLYPKPKSKYLNHNTDNTKLFKNEI